MKQIQEMEVDYEILIIQEIYLNYLFKYRWLFFVIGEVRLFWLRVGYNGISILKVNKDFQNLWQKVYNEELEGE